MVGGDSYQRNRFADRPPTFSDDDEFTAPPPFTLEASSCGRPEGATSTTSQNTELDYPNVGPIPNVNPRTAHYHLAILKRFCALYDAIESQAIDEAEKAKLVQQFLVCAESRYIRYLALLDDFTKTFEAQNQGTSRKLIEVMPLPPWDVAIIFHSHCLSPYRFFADMNRLSERLWNNGIAFPLARLYALIANRVWSDAASEQMWTGTGESPPYQLWNSDPSESPSRLQLQDVPMTCPWCDQTQRISLIDFTNTHTTKAAMCACASCGHKFDAANISAKYFNEDLLRFVKEQKGWIVKGAVSGAHNSDSSPEETARVDLQVVLQTVFQPPGEKITHRQIVRGNFSDLRIYLEIEKEPTWTGIVQSFHCTTTELKKARLLRMLSRGNFLNTLQMAYMGIMWRDLSIDLVAASLRQREFAKKITSTECSGIENPGALLNSNERYHKFLLLMSRASKKKKIAFVPTLDIDLSWHTHQLDAVAYRKWCITHLGIAVNHDDTVGKASLDTGLRETTRAWTDSYRESYASGGSSDTSDGLSQASSSKGGLFHSFGLFRKKEEVSKNGPGERKEARGDILGPQYMWMYPYWLKYPFGWNYPAACVSGSGGSGGWAASIDPQPKIVGDAAATCAGCTAGCTYVWGD